MSSSIFGSIVQYRSINKVIKYIIVSFGWSFIGQIRIGKRVVLADGKRYKMQIFTINLFRNQAGRGIRVWAARRWAVCTIGSLKNTTNSDARPGERIGCSELSESSSLLTPVLILYVSDMPKKCFVRCERAR